MIDWNMFFNTPGVAGAAQQNTLALIILVNNKLNDNIPPKYLKHLNSSGPDIGSWNVYIILPQTSELYIWKLHYWFKSYSHVKLGVGK